MQSLTAKWITVVLPSVIAVSLLVSWPKAEARGYGYDGGSFRGEGGYGAGARGGEYARGPYGEAAVRGPYGTTAVRGPEGNVAVGDRVTTLPPTAQPVVVGGQTYYVNNNVYYQQGFDGSDVVYVTVPAPQQ